MAEETFSSEDLDAEDTGLPEHDMPEKPCPNGCGRTMEAWRYASECQACTWDRTELREWTVPVCASCGPIHDDQQSEGICLRMVDDPGGENLLVPCGDQVGPVRLREVRDA